jgi:hypothetical protein
VFSQQRAVIHTCRLSNCHPLFIFHHSLHHGHPFLFEDLISLFGLLLDLLVATTADCEVVPSGGLNCSFSAHVFVRFLRIQNATAFENELQNNQKKSDVLPTPPEELLPLKPETNQLFTAVNNGILLWYVSWTW